MYSKEQLIELMKEKFQISINQNQISEESVLLYHEEIYEDFVSTEMLKRLPNPVCFQTFGFDHNNEEWIVGVAYAAEAYEPLFLVCIKNGLKVYEELLVEEK